MENFKILSDEQIFGDNALDIFKEKGSAADITDFAILLGGYSREGGTPYDKLVWKERVGSYWIDAEIEFGNLNINYGGFKHRNAVSSRKTGIRLAKDITSIDEIPSNDGKIESIGDGFYKVEYGYVPQTAVSRKEQEALDEIFDCNLMFKTGNSYTTDTVNLYTHADKFKPQVLEEYEYQNNRYVKVPVNVGYKDTIAPVSNGEDYTYGEYVWVKVEPIQWWIDEKAKIMFTEKVILSGIQYSNLWGVTSYDESFLKEYINTYMEKELFQEKRCPIKSMDVVSKKEELYNFNWDEIDEIDIIKGAIKADVSIFLHGKPGCGKSARIRQLDPDFIELNLSHLDPELLDGLAGERNGEAVHIKPPWLVELEAKCKDEPDKIHLIFLDELTNASPMMQAKAYGIALEKKVAGKWKLPANARVVAAGNEIEDSIAANEIAEPLYDRFAHVNIETRLEDWLNWAISDDETYEKIEYKKEEKKRNKIHPAIYAYIAYRGDGVLNTPFNPQNPKPHGNPRRWEMASKMLYETNNPNVLNAVVGENLTKDFIAFCKLPTLTIEDILEDNYTEDDLEMDLGRKLATVAGLVAVDEDDFSKVREFVKKLGPEVCKKFEVQWAHGDFYRLALIKELRMMEMQSQKHTKNEAQHYSKRGIIAFKNVAKNYDGFLGKKLSKEEMMVG